MAWVVARPGEIVDVRTGFGLPMHDVCFFFFERVDLQEVAGFQKSTQRSASRGKSDIQIFDGIN